MSGPDIFCEAFARDPYPLYRVMRDEYPLYFHETAHAYILSRYDDVSHALSHADFTTRSYAAQIEPLLGVTIVQLDGRAHARQRRLLAPSFRGDQINAAFGQDIAALADRLIRPFRDQTEVELVGDFITAFAVGALAIVVGLPQSDLDLLRPWYTALLRFGVNLAGDAAVTAAGHRARDELDAYLRPLVSASRRAPGPGLLSMLAHSESEGQRLSDDEIVQFAMLMIFAGGETIEKTIATFLRNLVAHPDQLARLRANRSLLDQGLAESLRYTAPTHMVPRRTQRDTTIGGGVIPAESEVICFLGAANRDERRFTQPDRFDIFRSDLNTGRAFTSAADHMSFGTGRHFCLGAMMARVEVTIAMNKLLDVLAEVRFVGETPADVGMFLRGPQSLRLHFDPIAANRAVPIEP